MQKALGQIFVPFNPPLSITAHEFGRGKPVLSVVGGLHGNAYNSLYICALLLDWLRRMNEHEGPYVLRGRVRVLPAANPLGLLVAERNWPFDNTDLDLVFPGYTQGETAQRLASWVLEFTRASNCCVDLHGSSDFIEELPQALVYSAQPRALELAKAMGLPFIWSRCLSGNIEQRPQALEVVGSAQGTLAYNLYQLGIDILVVRAGIGMRLDLPYCRQVFASLIRLALQLGVVAGPLPEEPGVPTPEIAQSTQLQSIHCRRAGLFIPSVNLGQKLEAGESLGQILDPLCGERLEEVSLPRPGTLVALRTHPVVLQGSLVARLTGA